jgi:hypothetical protein
MFYLAEQERVQQAQSLISLGHRIGFLVDTQISGEYRIVARGARRDSLEQTLQDKWARWQLDRDLEQEILRKKEDLQAELRKERAKFKSISDF